MAYNREGFRFSENKNKISESDSLDGVEQNNTLEYTDVKSSDCDLNKKIDVDTYNHWIVPKESIIKTEEGVKEWPCSVPSEEWDTNGIQKINNQNNVIMIIIDLLMN